MKFCSLFLLAVCAAAFSSAERFLQSCPAYKASDTRQDTTCLPEGDCCIHNTQCASGCCALATYSCAANNNTYAACTKYKDRPLWNYEFDFSSCSTVASDTNETEGTIPESFFNSRSGYITLGAIGASAVLCFCTWCCCIYGFITTGLERVKSTKKIKKQQMLARERVRHANHDDDDTSMIDRSAVALKSKNRRRKNIIGSSD